MPVKVLGISDATTITTGYGHSCALHQTGTISCWGANWAGQLGNSTGGNNEDRSLVPVQVQGITNATAVTTGYGHSCALHQIGTISCWGNNWTGQLGNSTTTDSSVPVQVQDISDTTTITTSNDHSCALHQDGTISRWGNNENGQLGNGSDPRVPNLVVGFGG